jgi:hypothetical protein
VKTPAERAAESAGQQARAAEKFPGAVQYQAQIGHLARTSPPYENMSHLITRWGLRNLATGQPVPEPDGRTGPATAELPAPGEPGKTWTYTMPGSHEDEPAVRLTGNLDDLHAWVRELGGGVLHIGRQWYHLEAR